MRQAQAGRQSHPQGRSLSELWQWGLQAGLGEGEGGCADPDMGGGGCQHRPAPHPQVDAWWVGLRVVSSAYLRLLVFLLAILPSRIFGRKTFTGSRSSEKSKGRARTKPKLVTRKGAATSNATNSPGPHSPGCPRGRRAVAPLGPRLCPRSGKQITAGSRPVFPPH